MGSTHNRAYRGGTLIAENFPTEQISDFLDEADVVVWADFCNPDEAELNQLADELGMHELAVEDALSAHQRPKVDFYDSHLFLCCHTVEVSADSPLEEIEVNAFMAERWLVTVRKDERFPLAPVLQRWDRSAKLVAHGVGFLLYGLLDVVVDGYFAGVSAFDDYYDEVSEGLFADTPLDPARQRDWFQMRQALVRFHRLVVPMREAVSSLLRRDHGIIAPELYPYFQDVYDHVLRVTESTDALRDLVGTIVETNLSLRDFRQNQIMKKVTSWAAILAVPTLITGFYGMNVPYPGFDRTDGFLTSIVLMVVLSGVLYWQFRRRQWL